eukprot:4700052-Pyramimonas_sp.AAC.2
MRAAVAKAGCCKGPVGFAAIRPSWTRAKRKTGNTLRNLNGTRDRAALKSSQTNVAPDLYHLETARAPARATASNNSCKYCSDTPTNNVSSAHAKIDVLPAFISAPASWPTLSLASYLNPVIASAEKNGNMRQS